MCVCHKRAATGNVTKYLSIHVNFVQEVPLPTTELITIATPYMLATVTRGCINIT